MRHTAETHFAYLDTRTKEVHLVPAGTGRSLCGRGDIRTLTPAVLGALSERSKWRWCRDCFQMAPASSIVDTSLRFGLQIPPA